MNERELVHEYVELLKNLDEEELYKDVIAQKAGWRTRSLTRNGLYVPLKWECGQTLRTQ